MVFYRLFSPAVLRLLKKLNNLTKNNTASNNHGKATRDSKVVDNRGNKNKKRNNNSTTSKDNKAVDSKDVMDNKANRDKRAMNSWTDTKRFDASEKVMLWLFLLESPTGPTMTVTKL